MGRELRKLMTTGRKETNKSNGIDIFIVAPCTLKIHQLLNPNKCTTMNSTSLH
jgi:hypothetical protein